MTHKSDRLERPVARYETIERRHVEIRRIRNDLHNAELDSPRQRSLGDSRGFHVDSNCVIRFGEASFLLLTHYVYRTDEHSATRLNLCSHSICGIDYRSWHKHIADP
jgi:hypothetical protein